MSVAGRRAGGFFLLATLPFTVQPLFAQHGAAPAPAKAEAHKASPKESGTRMTDAQASELAKEALGAEDPASIRAALTRLKGHAFKSSKVPERELVLYAQGMLEARLGNLSAASVALKKLERQWPKSPFMGEAQTILAEDAAAQKRYKEAEGRLHQALASDIPSERKRKPQELLIWTLVEQGRPQEALPIVQSLHPLEGKEKPSERGLAAIVEVLSAAGERDQAQGSRKDFHNLYPRSELVPRVELAWGRLLGRSGEARESAQILRKLIQDHPRSAQADDARLALASLLTDGSLPDAKDMPSAESLLAEVRKGGKGLPKGAAQVVELRLLTGKTLWEDALNLVDRMDPAIREGQPEVKKLWTEAWKAWVDQRLEKGFAGELLARMKGGAFAALDAQSRLRVAELFASQGLLQVIPRLLPEAPASERKDLRKAALDRVQPEAQPEAVLRLLPLKGDTPDEALLRARVEAAQEHWIPLRSALGRARPGVERIKAVLRLLQRPIARTETQAQRLSEAEGWLARAPEKGEAREPLAILVADLRFQHGDARGALAMYPVKAAAPGQRGWVALMRAQTLMKLGQREQARATIKEARDEQGFKGQRDALAKSLGAY
jgi:TolA-binding protein